MTKAAATRAADHERYARLGAPPLEECFELALRRVRAQLATRAGSDSPLVRSPFTGTDIEGFVTGEAGTAGVLWCTYPVQPGPGVAVIALEGSLIALLMGRLFGEGDSQPSDWQPRSPTSVETAVSVRLCRELMDALAQSWSMGPAPRFLDGKVAPTSRVVAALDPATPMLCTSVQINSESSSGRFFVALAACLLVPEAITVPVAPPAQRAPRFDRVFPVEVEFIVELARLDLPLGTLERLAPGDEIQLGSVGEVEARVGGKCAFVGQPGITGGKRSFRIARRAISDSSMSLGDR